MSVNVGKKGTKGLGVGKCVYVYAHVEEAGSSSWQSGVLSDLR